MKIALHKFWTDCLHIVLGQTCSLRRGSLAFMCSHPVHKIVLADPPPYTLIPCPTQFLLELGHQSRSLNDNSRNRNANPCSLSLKINLSRSFSIGASTEEGPLAVLFAFELPCSSMALDVVDHSLYCFGIMMSALHAPLIDSPASTRLLTFLTIASLSKTAKRLLLLL